MNLFSKLISPTPEASLHLEGTKNLHTSVANLINKLGKKRALDSDKLERTLLESVSFSFQGLGVESGVYNDLASIWLKLDSLQQSHFDNININFLTSLESKLFELQEVEKSKASYEKLVSVLEKLEKLKLKKVNSNTEEEIHTASVNVEDAKFTLERKMLGIERGKEQEQNNLEDFVNSEIEYTKKYLSILQEAKLTFSTSSNLLPPKPFETRMSRSYSDPQSPEFSSSSPNRVKGQRRSTVNSSSRSSPLTLPINLPISNAKAVVSGTRSRSGSLLSMFSREKEGKKEEDFISGIKKSLGAGASSKYSSLSDEVILPLKTNFTPPESNSLTISPPFTRSVTAPLPAVFTPIGNTYSVKWEFSSTSTGELTLKVGSTILIERIINPDWWYGIITSAGEDIGNQGMFPSTFVVPFQSDSEIRENARWSISSSIESPTSNPYSTDDDDHEEESDLKPHSSNNIFERVKPPTPLSRKITSPFT